MLLLLFVNVRILTKLFKVEMLFEEREREGSSVLASIHYQCDQITRFVFQYWVKCSNENPHNSIIIFVKVG